MSTICTTYQHFFTVMEKEQTQHVLPLFEVTVLAKLLSASEPRIGYYFGVELRSQILILWWLSIHLPYANAPYL